MSGDAVEEEEATFDGSSLSAYQHDETDSLLPRSSRSVPPRVHTGSVLLDQPPAVSQQPYLHNPVQDQRQQHPSQHAVSSSGAPELITDLVMENSRLADEVANLRKMLSDQVLFCTLQCHGSLFAPLAFVSYRPLPSMSSRSIRRAVQPALGTTRGLTIL